MDTLLILLGVLGFGAIIIAIHVYSVDSESYGYGRGTLDDDKPAVAGAGQRESVDRRSGRVVTFPLIVNGELVAKDRRTLPDRRRSV